MKLKYKHILAAIAVTVGLGIALPQCTKPELDDDFPLGDPPPIAGGYVNSSEIAPSDLVVHVPFEGTVADLKGGLTGGTLNGNGAFTAGRKGQAYQGGTTAFVKYEDPGPVATLTSFTVAYWINTQKHDGGAQGLFALAKQDGSFWGNFFSFIEGNNSPSNRMFFKLHFEKNNAPFIEHWVEPHGFGPIDYRPDDMYGAWRHVVWSYDENTSKVSFYVSGEKRTLPPGAEDRIADGGGTPLGPLNFKNPTKFVIGGFQNHAGSPPFNAPEVWMLNYTGKMDEFRVYKRALTTQEVSALYKLERQGR
jgi:hypothetical protein